MTANKLSMLKLFLSFSRLCAENGVTPPTPVVGGKVVVCGGETGGIGDVWLVGLGGVWRRGGGLVGGCRILRW